VGWRGRKGGVIGGGGGGRCGAVRVMVVVGSQGIVLRL